MTQEKRQLLLKDLCERLPYGVMAKPNKGVGFIPARITAITDFIDIKVTLDGSLVLPIDMVQPYLRPMYSMSEEEKKEFQACHCVYELHPDFQPMMCNLANECNMFDWLNAHHFDYRSLINKGLALEASEDMYKED
jgi:hypothetical protein